MWLSVNLGYKNTTFVPAMTSSLEQMEVLFQHVHEMLLEHVPPLVVSRTGPDLLELIGNVPVPYGSTKKIVPGMYFCTLQRRKAAVSFYLFPLYAHPELAEVLAAGTRKCLTGKTCFRFTKQEQFDEKSFRKLLKASVQCWKKNGYLSKVAVKKESRR